MRRRSFLSLLPLTALPKASAAPPVAFGVAAAAAGRPAAAAAAVTDLGMNFGIASNYTDSAQFLNLFRAASGWAGDGAWQGTAAPYADRLGWPANVPRGLACDKIVKIFPTPQRQPNWRPGRYVVTWSGDFSAQLGGLVSNVAATDHRVEFDLPPAENLRAAPFLQVGFTSRADGASLADVQVYNKAYEAQVRAGELFDPDFLASLAGVKVLRFMEWNRTNGLVNTSYPLQPTVQPDDLPTEATCYWGARVPPSVWARLCAKLGADMWATVPYGGDPFTYGVNPASGRITTAAPSRWSEGQPIVFYANQPPAPLAPNTVYFARDHAGNSFRVYRAATGGAPIDLSGGAAGNALVSGIRDMAPVYEAIARQIAGVAAFQGKVDVEYSNENWNAGFAHYLWLEGVAGVGLASVDDAGQASKNTIHVAACAAAQQSLKAWQVFESVLGRSRVIRTFAGQGVAFARFGGAAMEYADAASGRKFKTLMDAYAPTYYFYPAACNGFTQAQLTEKLQAERRDDRRDDAWWQSYMNAAVDAAITSLQASAQGARAKKPDIRLRIYEANHHFTFTNNASSTANAYTFAAGSDPTLLESIGGVDIGAAFDDGEEGVLSSGGGTLKSPTGAVSANVPVFVRRVSATQLRLYRSRQDYDADSPATRVVFGPGIHYLNNWTRKNALYHRMQAAVTDAAIGVPTMQRHFEGARQAGCEVYCFFALSNNPPDLNRAGPDTYFWGQEGIKTSPTTVNGLAAWQRRTAAK
jgi:hypothetical protein